MPRNVSGTYTLPLPAVVSGDVIQAAWANTSLDDIGLALTDSLDRHGRGGMLAPFFFADGTLANPGGAFLNAPGTGFYRTATEVGFAWNAALIFSYNGNGLTIAPTKEAFSSTAPSTGNSLTNKTYVDALFSGAPGGGYLPLAAGASYPLSGTLYAALGIISNAPILAIADAGAFGLHLRGRASDGAYVQEFQTSIGTPTVRLISRDTGALEFYNGASAGVLKAMLMASGNFEFYGTHVSGNNFIIGQQTTAEAGTFGFYNGNGPGLACYGNAAGGANAGSLQISTPSYAQFNPVNPSGVRFNLAASGYAQWLQGGVGLGYIGSSAALAGGTAATELGVRSESHLRLISGGGTGLATLATDGQFVVNNSINIGFYAIGLSPVSDVFAYAPAAPSINIPNYGITWQNNTSIGGGAGPTGHFSAYGGLAFFTQSGLRMYIDSANVHVVSAMSLPTRPVENTAWAANTANVQQSTVGSLVRTWQDMSGSRVFNVNYTSPAYPIEVAVSINFSANGAEVRAFVGATPGAAPTIIVGIAGNGGNGGLLVPMTSFVVPPNTQYQIQNTVAVANISAWCELR